MKSTSDILAGLTLFLKSCAPVFFRIERPQWQFLALKHLKFQLTIRFLGHHGFYCHIPTRKTIHATVLRTSRAIYDEARAVLYGENIFYLGTFKESQTLENLADPKALGPLNHKPTYSASLPTTIGIQNATSIKKVIFHSTYLADLDPNFINFLLSKQGINPSAMRVIAISQSSPAKTPVVDIPTHAAQMLPTQGPPPQLMWQVQPQNSTPVSMHSWQTVEQPEHKVREFLEGATEDLQGYFDIMRTKQVEKLAAIKNSDLRAGGLWLVHVSDDIRQRAGAMVLVGDDEEECKSKELLSRLEIQEALKNRPALID